MNIRRLGVSLFLMIASLVGVLKLQQQTLNQQSANNTETYSRTVKQDQIFLDTLQKLPTLGFDNLLADWTYLRFIQYFGDQPARDITGHDLIPQFFRLIVQYDPKFIQALLMLSSANTLYAFAPQTTVNLMDQALKKITPHISYLAPYVWSYKGVDEMLFLNKNKSAQHSYEMAAKWAWEGGFPEAEAVAKRNAETAAFLAKNPDSKKARVAAWSSILENALDKRMQEMAISEIRALGGNVNVNPDGSLAITFPDKD